MMIISRLAILVSLLITFSVNAEEVWLPVKDISLIIEPDSILDFSQIADAAKPIDDPNKGNSQRYFSSYNQNTKPQRYLMASLGFGVYNGGFPSHSSADLYVKQLRMHGYNMARLDFIESTLMEQRKADFDFDPEQLDRLYYLLAALKKADIPYILNGLSSDNGGYGSVAERWLNKKGLVLGVYYDVDKQEHWKILMKKLFVQNNPYTGQSILKDTALAGLIMVNESGLPFITRNGVPNELRPLFVKWLKQKYGSNDNFSQAWKSVLTSGESLNAGIIDFAKTNDASSIRMSDTQRFFVDLEQSTADWMTQYFRSLGYTGMLTMYNNWLSPAEQAARSQLEWVDMHNYFAHPDYSNNARLTVNQDSMLAKDANYIRELAVSRYLGKPYTISEFGQVFWNKYRRESGLAFPAYASLQGWDAICQHSGAIQLSYASLKDKLDVINPFAVGVDPITRATETLGALLYLRGDVLPAQHTTAIKLSSQFAFNESGLLGGIPSDLSRLALITGVGLDWEGSLENSGKYDAQFSPGNNSIKLINGKRSTVQPDKGITSVINQLVKSSGTLGNKVSKANFVVDRIWANRVDALRANGLLDNDNLTDPYNHIYQSDTGQIVLDGAKKRLFIITPKTEAVVFDTPESISLKNLTIDQADSAALVSVSAMDGKNLNESGRMLIVLATDARNSNMRFTDKSETGVQTLGTKPIVIRTARLKLNLRNINKSNLQVFSTNLRGQRVDKIPVEETAEGISFVLDTNKLSHGPTTYFEISQ